MAAAKVVSAVAHPPARALGLLSALSQAALVWPLLEVFRRLALGPGEAAAAAVLVLANPVLWLNGARPMSDSFGLLMILAAQALLLRSLEEPRRLPMASLAAAVALGTRLQSALLTLPLWLLALARSRRGRVLSAAAFGLGVVGWAVPLVIQSGGLATYRATFVRAAADSVPVEPLLAHLTPNRVARAAVWVLLRPWGSVTLGTLVLVFAAVGFVAALRRRRAALALALLAFGPYLVAHALVQEVDTVRYSLPYLPLIAWLVVVGGSWLLPRPQPYRAAVGAILTADAVIWCAALAVPALVGYHRGASPPFAALRALEPIAVPREAFALGGHYMFFRYLGERPAGLELIPPAPRREVPGLEQYWLGGGARTVLFLGEPERTDLESVDPRARRTIGRWQWPADTARLLSGERPNRADLVSIERPAWFTSEGWLLSLEAGRIAEQRRFTGRSAHLLASDQPAFLLIAGEPTEPDAGRYALDLRLAGKTIAHLPCGAPILEGFALDPSAATGYLELSAITSRNGTIEGASFALRGLDYGPRGRPGFVHGDGWHYPETDEAAAPFRWASSRARSLLHIPAEGAVLHVEGVAPLEYLRPGVRVRLLIDGTERASAELRQRGFALEVPLDGSTALPRAELTADRSFVPDRIQHNGDRRELALRVCHFDLLAKSAAPAR